jgi:hypothetical protein
MNVALPGSSIKVIHLLCLVRGRLRLILPAPLYSFPTSVARHHNLRQGIHLHIRVIQFLFRPEQVRGEFRIGHSLHLSCKGTQKKEDSSI